MRHEPRAADLHAHFSGAITASQYLRFLRTSAFIASSYDSRIERVFGRRPDLRALVAACDAGNPGAEAAFARQFVFDNDDAGSFDRFRAKLEIYACSVASARLAAGDATAVAAVAREGVDHLRTIVARVTDERVNHTELRISGGAFHGHLAEVLSPLLMEVTRIRAGVTIAVSLPRENPWPVWEQVQRLVLMPHGTVVTAVDFSGTEAGHPPSGLREVVDDVRRFGDRHPNRALAVLCHVGEVYDDKSLESGVRWVHETALMGANRLGHALALGVDPRGLGPHERSEPVSERADQLRYDIQFAAPLAKVGVHIDVAAAHAELAQLATLPSTTRVSVSYDTSRLDAVAARQVFAMTAIRELGTVVEVCPTANRRIAGMRTIDEHPLFRFLHHNVPVVVGTDNAGLLATTLAAELEAVTHAAPDGRRLRVELLERAWASRSEVLSGRALVTDQHH